MNHVLALCLFACAVLVAGCASADHTPASAIREIELSRIEAPVTGYATFQSHNQKIVANRRGIFATYIRTRNEPYTAQNWRLVRSTDGGKTCSTVYEATHATNPPALETDDRDNVYLFLSDWNDRNAYLYRFLASDDYAKPLITPIPNAAAGKYAAAIDLPRKQLYFFSHNEYFNVLGLDGKLLRTTHLLAQGADAYLQYPQLFLDNDGTLHAAWTTQKKDVYLYWDIHHMLSHDGGVTWQNLDGTPLKTPVIADQHGPTTRVTRDDEYDVHTFLANFIANAGKLHFTYLAQSKPPRMHYVRYDIASAKRDVDLWPEFKGETLSVQGLDGFFARHAAPSQTIYCTMRREGYLVCLVSRDNGATWHDYARSKEKIVNAYAIGGCRTITDDDWIIGTFTDSIRPPSDLEPACIAYFFRIKAE